MTSRDKDHMDAVKYLTHDNKRHRSGYLMDNMWEASEPDVPHFHLSKDERCYICGETRSEMIVFQHNEGCHSSHCRRCLERMLSLFPVTALENKEDSHE